MQQLRMETRIEAPPAACFALSLSVDAHTLSMRTSGERAIAGVVSGELRVGETVTWRAWHLGVPWRMTVTIAEYDAPHRFVDEQVAGPFASWWHEHRFEPEGSGTRMIDLVEFAAPLGPLGRLAERLLLRRYMHRLLHRRNDWLKRALEADG